MAHSNSTSKMARNAGGLMAIVGLVSFFAAVFNFAPRSYLVIGIVLIGLSLVAYFVEEAAERREELVKSR